MMGDRTTLGQLSSDYLAGVRIFTGLDMSGISIQNMDLTDAIFRRCDLYRADFKGVNLTNCTFENCDLNSIVWSEVEASGLHILGSTLFSAIITDSSLPQSYLARADLRLARISDTDMSNSTLHNCNATGSSLRKVNLSKVDLRSCNLTAADLTGSTTNNRTTIRRCILDLITSEGWKFWPVWISKPDPHLTAVWCHDGELHIDTPDFSAHSVYEFELKLRGWHKLTNEYVNEVMADITSAVERVTQ